MPEDQQDASYDYPPIRPSLQEILQRGEQQPEQPRPRGLPIPADPPQAAQPIPPQRGGASSQAGLGAWSGGEARSLPSVPKPGEPGSRFNPQVRERPAQQKRLPAPGAQMVDAADIPRAPGPDEDYSQESVAGAAVKGFTTGFAGGTVQGARQALPLPTGQSEQAAPAAVPAMGPRDFAEQTRRWNDEVSVRAGLSLVMLEQGLDMTDPASQRLVGESRGHVAERDAAMQREEAGLVQQGLLAPRTMEQATIDRVAIAKGIEAGLSGAAAPGPVAVQPGPDAVRASLPFEQEHGAAPGPDLDARYRRFPELRGAELDSSLPRHEVDARRVADMDAAHEASQREGGEGMQRR